MFLKPSSTRGASRSNSGDRIRWGLRWGAYYSVILTAWVTLLWLLRGSRPFEGQSVTLVAVVTLYVVGGPVTGAIVGLLLPFARSGLGAAITGIVAAIPISVMAIATVGGFPPWTTRHSIASALMAVTGGALAGYVFRAFLSDDP